MHISGCVELYSYTQPDEHLTCNVSPRESQAPTCGQKRALRDKAMSSARCQRTKRWWFCRPGAASHLHAWQRGFGTEQDHTHTLSKPVVANLERSMPHPAFLHPFLPRGRPAPRPGRIKVWTPGGYPQPSPMDFHVVVIVARLIKGSGRCMCCEQVSCYGNALTFPRPPPTPTNHRTSTTTNGRTRTRRWAQPGGRRTGRHP